MAFGETILATVVRGHRVASGAGGDPRFPDGTLAMQLPHFAALGLDLSPYYLGTINLSIAPHRYEIGAPKHTFRGVGWSPVCPPEDFSFFDCAVTVRGHTVRGLVYYPHPDTKPAHFQAEDTLEVLAERIDNLSYGDQLRLAVVPEQMRFVR